MRVHPHVVFETAAYIIAFAGYRGLRRQFGDHLDAGGRWSVIAAAFCGAALGSRMLAAMENPIHPSAGGKTIVGGLIGGLIAVELTKRAVGIRQPTGDLFAVPICIGIAIGRVGCFLTGLSDNTYGLASALPWAVDFGDGIRRHPVQLYEAVFAVLLAMLLFWHLSGSHRNGDTFKLFIVSYMAWRLGIEFLKPRYTVAELSTIQWACALCLLYYFGATTIQRRNTLQNVDGASA
jgi:prolipoprotein diacylglyceryltransferase